MRIAVIGTGYVGLVSGACFSEFGVDVVCVDKDSAKIESLRSGRHADLRARPRQAGGEQRQGRPARLLDRRQAGGQGRGCGVHRRGHAVAARRRPCRSLLCLRRGQGDRRGRRPATRSSSPNRRCRSAPADEVARILREARPHGEFDVASNPEFLREGSAIDDFMRPDRVIIGAESERAREVMRRLYRPLYLIETPILFTSIETAELIKYAANTFLATKITFINEIADLCEKVGANVNDVARGIGLDGRIGAEVPPCRSRLRRLLLPQGHAGPGQDRAGLRRAAQDRRDGRRGERGAQARHGRAGHRVASAARSRARPSPALGLTFKPNTDDMRDSPSLGIVPALLKAGRHDPRLRSRGHGGGEEADARPHLLRRRL